MQTPPSEKQKAHFLKQLCKFIYVAQEFIFIFKNRVLLSLYRYANVWI